MSQENFGYLLNIGLILNSFFGCKQGQTSEHTCFFYTIKILNVP